MNHIALSDLLPRRERALDMRSVSAFLRGKHVAVTGAAGFIGSELSRQIATFEPGMLTLLDISEFGIYQISRQLPTARALVADVRDLAAMFRVLQGVDVVFHAAALKHVPIVEAQPLEGVATNIIGTANVVSASGGAKIVMVSTDKAVRPASVMGRTKRVAEMIAQRSGRAAVVRFGNVIGSSGSVVPLFMEQIQRGGPVTITHPDMERYFMTVAEAAELILQAGAHGDGVYVLDMGAPVKIRALAEDMILLSGKRGVEIEISGMRPGERLQEELFYERESLQDVGIDGVMMAENSGGNEGEHRYDLLGLQDAVKVGDERAACELLMEACG